ncbi:GNAT family N-acetyltransferase [Pontibacter chinhatensis]|uniref:Protein N-acetyltransferase, RimJ/RimL family n=1 Tax=Pontibacter chinhatensis TaxID=1436961 RepID=A0A1I2T927_9BACT|nr:GNAT family N-acetyltransferase [Pontibacter chinhatensis]SFG61342.1 Protein N-acetyltransferase, RimJ/RimL family [Pontibacter chinhatensis]
MNLHLRTLTLTDTEAITNLSSQLGYQASVAETNVWLQEILASKDHCAFGAVLDDKLVGWVHGFYTLHLESGAFVEIGGLVVDENCRRTGAGRMLVEQVRAWAGQKGIGKVRVRCNTRRTDSHTFYKVIGFEELKEQKVFSILC